MNIATLYRLLASCFYLLPDWITKRKRYFKACISGLISLCLQLIVFNILRTWLKATWANTIAVEIAILCNFTINNYYTFRDKTFLKTGVKTTLAKAIQFNTISLSSMAIQFMSLHIELVIFCPHLILENIAVLIGIVIGSVVNFLLYKAVIWRH